MRLIDLSDQQNMRFEKALLRLEEIVKLLESGELPLDEALKLFQEGVNLSAHCTRLLDEAEKTIQVVTAAKDGSVTLSEHKPGSN